MGCLCWWRHSSRECCVSFLPCAQYAQYAQKGYVIGHVYVYQEFINWLCVHNTLLLHEVYLLTWACDSEHRQTISSACEEVWLMKKMYCSCALSYQPAIINIYTDPSCTMDQNNSNVSVPSSPSALHIQWCGITSQALYPHHDESTWFCPLLSKEQSVLLLRERVDETL